MIQFGAVKLDTNNEIIGRYESFVKPRYSHIDEKVSNLTNITGETVSNAPDYLDIINGFLDWAGDTSVVLAWSNEDLKVLKNESIQKGFSDIRLDKMFANWVDLQKCFGDEIGVSQQIALSSAVRGIGREFVGVEHSAMDDAENTAFIFQELQADNFREKHKELLDLFKPYECLTFSLGSMFSELMAQVSIAG
ncbi:MAG: exonuclease domain-containing protein [Lachnospiraceae bacterium]|nr:exonuclease domain-containing protein [Lachnospiraceae bacterium]